MDTATRGDHDKVFQMIMASLPHRSDRANAAGAGAIRNRSGRAEEGRHTQRRVDLSRENTQSGSYFWGDHQADDELTRLKLIEQFNDPSTFRHLDAIGVADGWRCLEVGAGAGSVVRWLSQRVGPAGRVVAADLDVRFLSDNSAQNVEVRRCDITQDPIEQSSYDLVHARSVLTHLGDPVAVLRRMTAALRPGGWLIIEDTDNGTVEAADSAHPFAAAFDLCAQARIKFLLAGGVMDLRYGRTLPAHMEELKFIDVGNEGLALVGRGGSPMSQLMIESFQPIDDAMVANGVVGQSDASDARCALADPSFLYRSGLVVAVWGRNLSQDAHDHDEDAENIFLNDPAKYSAEERMRVRNEVRTEMARGPLGPERLSAVTQHPGSTPNVSPRRELLIGREDSAAFIKCRLATLVRISLRH
jgi:SAM-dependent methyltransferase